MVAVKKRIWLWLGLGLGGVALVTGILLLLIALIPPSPEPKPEATTVTTGPTVPLSTLNPSDFGYVDGYLTCLTAPSIRGVDVSSHKENIDWEAVKASGVEFAMLRLGYRGTDLGGIYEDEWFRRNYEGAKAAGLQVGAYFFSQAITPEEAAEEAAFALDILAGDPLDMPLVFDWEDSGPESRVAAMDPDTLTACTVAFCDSVAAAGYRPMIYFNPTQARELVYLDALTDYPFWLAMYSDEMTFPYHVDMWQYTCTGHVPGINGDVDINLYFP